MLTPITGVHRAQPLSKKDMQKENTLTQEQPLTNKQKQRESSSADTSVTGQTVDSPLGEFLNDEQMEELMSDQIPDAEQGGPAEEADGEALGAITEMLQETEVEVDQDALVADLMETIPELQVVAEQSDVFSTAPTDDPVSNKDKSGESVVQGIVEAVAETMAETSVETLVNNFVKTEDIAKLVSSTSLVSNTRSIMNLIGKKMVEKTVMLLKNGMAYTNLTTPPGQLEIPSSIESAVGSAWTTWRQDEETGAIYLGSESAGGETRLTGVEIDLEPLSIADIAGTHTKVEAKAWSATQQTQWSDVIFHEDGTFEYAVTTLRTTGGYDTHWLESFSQSASYSSANRPVVNADGTIEPSDGPPRTNMFGSFKLAEDGLSIELTYADGSVESRLIYKNDGQVHFGGKSFTTRQATKEELAQWRERLLALDDDNFLGADWLSIIADSAAAVNDHRDGLSALIHAPSTGPTKG